MSAPGLTVAAPSVAAGTALLVLLVVAQAAPGAQTAREPQDAAVEATVSRARALAAGGAAAEAADLLVAEASASFRRGELEPAEDLLLVATALAPSSPAAHSLLGVVRLSQMRFRLAAESLELARRLGDRSLRTTLYVAAARWENGDLAGSEELYREAVALSDGAALPLHQLGRLLLWQGRAEEAIEPLERAAARDPSATDVRLALARALERAGRDAEAVDVYRLVVEVEPEHPRAHYGLGRALARLGRNDEAVHHLALHDRLYRRDEERTREAGLLETELAAARAEAGAGDFAAALSRLDRLPETPDALAVRAAAHRQAGDLAAAVAALERAVAAAPDRDDLQALLRDARLAELAPH